MARNGGISMDKEETISFTGSLQVQTLVLVVHNSVSEEQDYADCLSAFSTAHHLGCVL